MRMFVLFLSCVMGCSGVAVGWAAPKAKQQAKIPADAARVISRQQQMTLALYRQFRRKTQGNILFSPPGIGVVLSMLSVGAKGATERGILRVLRAQGLRSQRWHQGMLWLHQHLRRAQHNGVVLHSAQNLWTENTGVPKVSFLRTLQRYYRVAPLLMNFRTQPERSRQQLNDWFRLQTRGMIPALFPKGTIDSQTRLVLGHAIFFQGSWANRFAKRRTYSGTFFLPARRVVTTPMMYQKHTFPYASSRGLQILELPYIGHHLSMVLLLPRRGGLSALEKRLRTSRLRRWLRGLRPKKVHVHLPRFAIQSTWNLRPALAALGMKRALGRKADFSKINGKHDLYVAMALQQARITVNEKGTKASAGTGLSVRAKNGHSYPVFKADHPFLFLIRDRRTNQLLFWGRVANPNPTAKIRMQPQRRLRK